MGWDFDQIDALVHQSEKAWHREVQYIRDGRPGLAEQRHRTPITDRSEQICFGTVVTDGRGTLRSIELDPVAVTGIYEDDITDAIAGAVNATFTQRYPRTERI
ncbi:hypothetical protein ACIA8C_35465 [Nocardia sp. NPDC051321]|uniref:hypothetical protein n=1 Tax=Nocardia sp. NPDC051321 TaxID=3364323 RepID=UPI0037A5AA6E